MKNMFKKISISSITLSVSIIGIGVNLINNRSSVKQNYYKNVNNNKKNITVIIRNPESLSKSIPFNKDQYDKGNYVGYYETKKIEKMVHYNLEYKQHYAITNANTLADLLHQWNNEYFNNYKNELFKFNTFSKYGEYISRFLKSNTRVNPEYLPETGANKYLALSSPTNSDSKNDPIKKGILNYSNYGMSSLYLASNDIFYITVWPTINHPYNVKMDAKINYTTPKINGTGGSENFYNHVVIELPTTYDSNFNLYKKITISERLGLSKWGTSTTYVNDFSTTFSHDDLLNNTNNTVIEHIKNVKGFASQSEGFATIVTYKETKLAQLLEFDFYILVSSTFATTDVWGSYECSTITFSDYSE